MDVNVNIPQAFTTQSYLCSSFTDAFKSSGNKLPLRLIHEPFLVGMSPGCVLAKVFLVLISKYNILHMPLLQCSPSMDQRNKFSVNITAGKVV